MSDRLFIKADTAYSERWLHKDEMFKKEKNWNINLPDERQFKNGECIVTDKCDTAYSIDELINLLNYFNRCTISDKKYWDLKEENERLKKIIELIADAESYTKEESVKDILRHEIWGIDTVAGESAEAWNDYCILNDFFKEHYGEHWDNFEDK